MKVYLKLTLICLLIVISCKKNEDKIPQVEINNNLVHYPDISMKIKDYSALSKGQKTLYDSLLNDEEISFNSVTDLFIQKHLNHYNSLTEDYENNPINKISKSDYNKFINDITKDMPTENPHQMKISYEQKIENIKGKKIVYRVKAVNTIYLDINAALQCYSGTSSYEIIRRKAYDGKRFRELNFVTIFKSGHVFPGYIIKKNNKLYLFGVETTAGGRALAYLGPTSELNTKNSKYPIRVVDADLFVLTEIFKKHISNFNKVKDKVLTLAADKYNINYSHFKELVEAKYGVDVDDQDKNRTFKDLNNTLFGFGVSKNAKDSPREDIDVVSDYDGSDNSYNLNDLQNMTADSIFPNPNKKEESGTTNSDKHKLSDETKKIRYYLANYVYMHNSSKTNAYFLGIETHNFFLVFKFQDNFLNALGITRIFIKNPNYAPKAGLSYRFERFQDECPFSVPFTEIKEPEKLISSFLSMHAHDNILLVHFFDSSSLDSLKDKIYYPLYLKKILPSFNDLKAHINSYTEELSQGHMQKLKTDLSHESVTTAFNFLNKLDKEIGYYFPF